MATRMNMLKLLQEVSGFADFTLRRRPNRQPGALLLPLRWRTLRGAKEARKRIIRIDMRDLPDIPHPVAIRHVESARDCG
jgi:hypothetical protein